MNVDFSALLSDVDFTPPNDLPDDPAYLYRYEATVHYDESGWRRTAEIRLDRYWIAKRTPKGAWINVYGQRKFVLTDAHKRWACPDKSAALQSFIRRKERQVGILSAQLDNAKVALEYAKGINK
jgi:hypothetical protein